MTDSEGKIYASPEKPGITNLLNIYSALKEISLKDTETYFKNKNYKELKEEVAQTVKEFLQNIQTKYQQFLPLVDKLSKEGAIKAAKVAKANLLKLMKGMGLNNEK